MVYYPKFSEHGGPWTPAATPPGHLPAGPLGNTLARLENGH
jgi:hypothetical protein